MSRRTQLQFAADKRTQMVRGLATLVTAFVGAMAAYLTCEVLTPVRAVNGKGFLPPWAQYVVVGFAIAMGFLNSYLFWLNIREKPLFAREKRRIAVRAKEEDSSDSVMGYGWPKVEHRHHRRPRPHSSTIRLLSGLAVMALLGAILLALATGR